MNVRWQYVHGHGIGGWTVMPVWNETMGTGAGWLGKRNEGDDEVNTNITFGNAEVVRSNRIIYTPSSFARSSLIHLQETGTLQATSPHKSERSDLASYLFFTVLSGSGVLNYNGEVYALGEGDCVFINCRNAYSHETGLRDGDDLWSLKWCHFYGPNMNAIYRKYQERGGRASFKTEQLSAYHETLSQLYDLAASDDFVRDMRIHEKLSSLLIPLMEDAWDKDKPRSAAGETKGPANAVDIQDIKEYLDLNFYKKITVDELAAKFFINKYYLMSLFKERYWTTIINYVNQLRVTYIKQQLRFTDKTVEVIASELDLEPNYVSQLFKRVEKATPSDYRRMWGAQSE